MAGDTRDSAPTPGGTPPSPPSGAAAPPEHVKKPQIYELFNPPPPSVNALPDGSGQNTAGSRQEAPTLTAAVKTVRWQDFKQVHMYPCVRESLLLGIAGGFSVGGVRALLGGMSARLILFFSCFLLIILYHATPNWTCKDFAVYAIEERC